MLLTLICGLAFWGFFHLCFYPVIANLRFIPDSLQNIVTQVIGMTSALLISTFFVIIGISTKYIILVLAIFGIIGWGYYVYWNKRQSFRLHFPQIAAFIPLIPSGIYAFLSASGLISGGFTWRTGPDNFGWATSSISLCGENTLSNLQTRISNQLGINNVFDSFLPPQAGIPNYVSITQIPSFTDEIASAFLLGAHRTGIPGLLSSVCSLTTNASVYNFLLGGISIWAILLTSLLVVHIFRQVQAPTWFGFISASILPLSASILSVALEGGLGQLLSVPIFIFLIWAFVYKDFNIYIRMTALTSSVVFAITTYLDFVYVIFPFLIVLTLFQFKQLVSELKTANKMGLFAFAFVIAVSLFANGEGTITFITGFAKYGSISGWNQGFTIPLPGEVFGLTPWLPEDGNSEIVRNLSNYLQAIFTSLVLLFAALIGRFRYSLPIFIGVFLYIILVVQLFSSLEDQNNYRIWKLGCYLGATLTFLLAGLYVRRRHSPRGIAFRTKQYLAIFIVALSAISSITWSYQWHRNRQSLIGKLAVTEIQKVIDQYDLVINIPSQTAELAMYGDVRYVGNSRGFSLKTIRSNDPRRKLVVVRPKNGEICDINCAKSILGDSYTGLVIPLEQNNFYNYYLLEDSK